MLTLAATQPNARIDSNPIPAFPRVAFERQIEKNCGNAILLPLAKFNATQSKVFASICEPALTHTQCFPQCILIMSTQRNILCVCHSTPSDLVPEREIKREREREREREGGGGGGGGRESSQHFVNTEEQTT